MAQIRVKGYTEQGKEKILGEVEVDMAQYVGVQNEQKTVWLTKAA